jgi:hypothetical protein
MLILSWLGHQSLFFVPEEPVRVLPPCITGHWPDFIPSDIIFSPFEKFDQQGFYGPVEGLVPRL